MRSLLYVLAAFVTVSAFAAAQPAQLGDDQLRIAIEASPGELKETQFIVAGKPLEGIASLAWSARIDGKQFVPTHAKPAEIDTEGHLCFRGDADGFTWTVRYSPTGSGRVTKFLSISPQRDLRIEEVTLWQSDETITPKIARTGIQDVAAIYRADPDAGKDSRGLFVSLDFPYSRIDSANSTTTVSFPPHCTVRKGDTYHAHSLTIGATTRTGVERYGHDTGEVDAIDAYIQERFKPRFDRPMILSCSIVNRYTQVRGDVVFYTMHDLPTLRDNTDLLERELALMPQLGVEYYQVFPGVFDWGPNDPSAEQVDRLMNVARKHGVRMGDYSGTSTVFCAHYNEYRNHLNRPEWLIRDADNKPGSFCFGCPEFVDYYIQTVVPNAKRLGFEMHCLDFLSMSPCHATNHGHPVGRDSLYHATQGLVRLLQAIDTVSPEMMTWSNSGNWADLLPKIAWYNPNLYLTDPFISTPWQGLNMTRLLDDARREQMVSLHYSTFIPYRFLSNCQYFFSQNSISPDIRNYEYGALSTLAVTPNLCLGEIRPWLDRLPDADLKRVLSFYKHWTGFLRDNFDLWKKTCHAGENPGMGAVEIYSHAAGNRGFIFLVNPQYWSRSVEVPLNATLGFTGDCRCEIAELYPTPRLRLTSAGPFVQIGAQFTIQVPPQQVVVLEVRPAPESIDVPRVYGVAGTLEAQPDGYLLKTTGMQGSHERAAILLPKSSQSINTAQVRAEMPKIPKRLWSPTPVQLWSAADAPASSDHGAAALLDFTYRRESVPDELRDWTVRPGTLDEGLAGNWFTNLGSSELLRFPLFLDVQDKSIHLPMTDAQADQLGLGYLGNFCGAYIENAFGEMQETWIDLKTSGNDKPAATQPVSLDPPIPSRELSPQAKDLTPHWWVQTRFTLPFMYMIGAEPAFDEHTLLVLPLVRHHTVKRISAWINGQPLDVRAYRYPRNRGLACYYVDLVGTAAVGGENTLVVHLQY